MIKAESFAVSRETFAAERKQVLSDAAAEMAPHVRDALNRVGLPGWEAPIVSAALDLFDLTARAEVDEWNPVLDDMHDLFAEQLAATLEKTTPRENVQAQADLITGWVAQMAHNAAIEAATTSDPDGNVGLEWITMGDGNVRDSHQEANGQTVPTGGEFDVDGEKLLYPGQPVGDPSVWINCRCLAAPTMLGEMASETVTAGVDKTAEFANGAMIITDVSRETFTPDAGDQVVQEEYTSTVIVALPAADDPITAASSEASGAHATLLFLGDSAALDEAALNRAVEEFVTRGQVGIITEMVNGRATLGKDAADVVLFDAANLVFIRNGLLEEPALMEAHASVEQFPTWLPHVTLGYPATPALAEYTNEAITFDRLAVWHGESRTEYPLGGAMPKEPDAAPAAVTAAVEDAEPVRAEPATEAPAFPPAGEPEELRPWHGVLAPENLPSGDSRQFAINALTSRDLPLPLKAMFQDAEGHMGSVVVGRIDEIYRDGGLIKASGVWDISPEAEKASGMIERKMWRGVSVDLDAAEGRMVEASEEGGRESIEFSKGRVCSATLCAIPAFAEAFVRNGTWAQFANEPLPSGAMVEIPDWPGSDKAPALSLVASAAPVISADFFRNPMLEEPTPVTRGENGLIFGHLAEWSTCHIAYEICTTPPESAMNYAYFLTGQVFTDAGPVPVGQLTVGGGHAPDGISVRAAIAHYDNVATAVADITVGEDEFGIWFSGRIRPWATEQQIHELFAAGPSGDWREVYSRGVSSMELVAAHAVNVQGFPVARFAVEGGRTVSLVAAGALKPRPDAATVFADIRRLEFADVFDEISTMKGN